MKIKKSILALLLVMGILFTEQAFSRPSSKTYLLTNTCPSLSGKPASNIYMTEVSGTTYGWKLLCLINISYPSYEDAEKNLWKNSGIPKSEKNKYYLCNVREEEGTAWGIILVGQKYLTLIADIAKR